MERKEAGLHRQLLVWAKYLLRQCSVVDMQVGNCFLIQAFDARSHPASSRHLYTTAADGHMYVLWRASDRVCLCGRSDDVDIACTLNFLIGV